MSHTMWPYRGEVRNIPHKGPRCGALLHIQDRRDPSQHCPDSVENTSIRNTLAAAVGS